MQLGVKNNLRVVACLDADNEQLSTILEHCPALKQETSVLWMTHWTSTTMSHLPEMIIDKYLSSIKFGLPSQFFNFQI